MLRTALKPRLISAIAAVAVASALSGCTGATGGSDLRFAGSLAVETTAATTTIEATTTGLFTGGATSDVLGSDSPPMAVVDAHPSLGSDFNVDLALEHVRALTDFGVREAGSEAERSAAEYVAGQLRTFGYIPRIESFKLPNGRETRNVVAVKQGTSTSRVVIGGHMDSKSPSPGANDNATGVGAMLVIAEALANETTWATIEFVAFGSEEMIDSNPDHHHFGSRYRVQAMSDAERAATVAMLSVDMIGYGPALHARTMGSGPQSLSGDILAFAKERGVDMTYRRDEGPSGWSDHEAFELAGIPAVWIEWRDDPVYHTNKDTPDHLSRDKVGVVGQLVLDYVRSVDEARAADLR